MVQFDDYFLFQMGADWLKQGHLDIVEVNISVVCGFKYLGVKI